MNVSFHHVWILHLIYFSNGNNDNKDKRKNCGLCRIKHHKGLLYLEIPQIIY